MKRQILCLVGAIVLSIAALLCTRNPIGDRILAKACIFGQSKFGECQFAK